MLIGTTRSAAFVRSAHPHALIKSIDRSAALAVPGVRGVVVNAGGHGYFRVAYGALQKATVAEGIGRLVHGLRAILS